VEVAAAAAREVCLLLVMLWYGALCRRQRQGCVRDAACGGSRGGLGDGTGRWAWDLLRCERRFSLLVGGWDANGWDCWVLFEVMLMVRPLETCMRSGVVACRGTVQRRILGRYRSC